MLSLASDTCLLVYGGFGIIAHQVDEIDALLNLFIFYFFNRDENFPMFHMKSLSQYRFQILQFLEIIHLKSVES